MVDAKMLLYEIVFLIFMVMALYGAHAIIILAYIWGLMIVKYNLSYYKASFKPIENWLNGMPINEVNHVLLGILWSMVWFAFVIHLVILYYIYVGV